MKTQLPLQIHQATQNHSNCSNKIKMPKNSSAYRIESFIPVQNMNVEELRFIKINTSNFIQVCLK